MAKDKTVKEEPSNGHGKTKEEIVIPDIMTGGAQAVSVVEQFRNDIKNSNRGADLSKYYVMEGMQSKEKIDFFTEFINDDDVLRMNTIQSFVVIAPLTIRRTSKQNHDRITKLLSDVYTGHVHTHKTNMVSKGRGRETAYIKILSSDSSDSGIPSKGITKFFGVGGNGAQKK